MPPLLALTLCTIFVVFLLGLERKQFPEASRVLWIPTIWMLLIASKPLGIWFGGGPGGGDMESGSYMDRAFLIALLCLGLIILAKRRFNWSSAIRENIWVMLLIGYMLVSILWSDVPFISFKRWSRELVAVVMAFLVATDHDPRQAMQCIFRRTIYVLIPFSYILIHYFPKYGRDYARWSGALSWIGVALQKNGLAVLCLLAFFFLVWTLIRRCQGHDIPVVWYQTHVEVFLCILSIWLFMGPQHTLTYSATSTASMVVGLTALIGLLWMKKRGKLIGARTLMLIIAFVIAYGTITPIVGKLTIVNVASTLGRDETLTGRSEIWNYLVPYAMHKPILGHGFGGFWTDAIHNATSSHAHNGYLDVILNLGFVGHILLSMFLLSCYWKAQRTMTNRDFDWGALCICYLLMAVVHNIAESSIIGFTGLLSAVLLFMAVSTTANSNNQMISRRVVSYPKNRQ